MRAVVYLRNSSGKQVQAGTHEGQFDEAHRTGARLGAEVIAVYADRGLSAKSGKLAARGDFARLVADLPALKPDLCIVANVDRLTRTELFRELGAIWGPLQEAGVKVATAGGQVLDLASPDGQLLAMFESWRAARENAARSERTTRGRIKAVERNRPPARVPWALAFDAASGRWSEGDAASLLREAAGRVLGGESCEAIVSDWQARKVPTPSGKGRWCNSQLARMLRSPWYWTGEWAANNGAIVRVPPILDADLAARVHQALDRNKCAPLRRTRHEYLLEGIGRCGVCQAPLAITATHVRTAAGPVLYRYYACRRRRHPRLLGGSCTLPMRRCEDVDDRAWRAVRDWIEDPGLVEEGIAQLGGAATEGGRQALADLADAERRLSGLPDLEAEAYRDRDRGDLSAEGLRLRLRDLAGRRRVLEQQVATWRQAAESAEGEAVTLAELEMVIGGLRDRAAEATFAQRRWLVEHVTEGGWTLHSDGRVEAQAAFVLAAPSARSTCHEDKARICLRRKVIG